MDQSTVERRSHIAGVSRTQALIHAVDVAQPLIKDHPMGALIIEVVAESDEPTEELPKL